MAKGFMDDIFTTTTSFRHSFVIERALTKAAEEKRVTKTHIIECCLRGEHNLSRYIDEFDEEDLAWIHARQMEALRNRNAKRASMEAVREHEEVDERFNRQVTGK